MGTNVASGTATAMVVATGGRTYFGSLVKSIVGTRAQTAFDHGVNSLSWLLIDPLYIGHGASSAVNQRFHQFHQR